MLILGYDSRCYLLTELFHLFWQSLSPISLRHMGLEAIVTPERQRQVGSDDRSHSNEYAHLSAAWRNMLRPINWSPFQHLPKKPHTNAHLRQVQQALTAQEQAELDRNYERAHLVFNALVGTTAGPAPTHYAGDVVFDEHVIPTRYKLGGTGTRDELLHTADADMSWTMNNHKGTSWALGLTSVQRTHPLYGREVSQVATGIAIGRPTGGATADALRALDAHIGRGEGPPKRGSAEAVADMGFSDKNGLAEGLLQRNYRLCQEYHSKGRRASQPRFGTSSGGHIQGHGVILCPGADRLSATPIALPNQDDDYEEQLLAHDDLIREISAHTMKLNGLPKKLVKGTPGRPTNGSRAPAEIHRIDCVCPADCGLARCELRPQSMNADPSIPFIHKPPSADTSPGACRRTFSSFHASKPEVKYMNSRLVGSWEHADRYNGSRSRNEAFHSQLVDVTLAGLKGDRIQVFGIAAHGLLAAIAVSATNLFLNESFARSVEANGGLAPYEDRRAQRDTRRRILRRLRNRTKTL